MGRTRRCIAAGSTVAALVLVSACGSGDEGTTAGGDAKVAAVIKGLDNPFFQSMEAGINDQAKTSGTTVTVQAANSISDTTGQADKLTGLAGQDFGCYIVNPISGTNLIQGIAQLAAQKKTIVNIDSPVDAEAAKAANATPATYIGTNNVSAGQKAGEQMLTLLPGGGKVAAIGGTAGDVTSGARVEGFTTAVTGKLELVQTVAANWERQEALTQATNILRAQPDLAGFFVANDDMGLGVARAVATAGKTGQVKVISVDGIKDALEAVKAGQVDAVVAQYPYAIGQMGMEACQAAAKGATLPASVEAPVEVVTKENADKALAATPKPFGEYADPFTSLIG
ncbi:ribose transport system substrate-binding protein [Actinoplanes lutulentus]|uniref:Allose-binding protein n=1 Tax=Actinoplanes lutulentus TaxID=1287878 RepID=A0A327ZQC1_9ACTN|nr:substrate-binding domain-containing protein [Actinoplanes lutulentus]MBB2940757.1 ribose transport system substrate-binding protein [Actinoplanes lutulentus]RAK43068.1 allose-binding protein [Actinoplanes lutulentus]